MIPMEVMIEELQADQRIPRGIPFCKGMRFASEGIEPITQGAIDSLDVNSTGFGNDCAQSGTDLNGKEFSMLISMLNGLRQSHHGRGRPAEDAPVSPNEPADDTRARG